MRTARVVGIGMSHFSQEDQAVPYAVFQLARGVFWLTPHRLKRRIRISAPPSILKGLPWGRKQPIRQCRFTTTLISGVPQRLTQVSRICSRTMTPEWEIIRPTRIFFPTILALRILAG